MSKYFYDMSDEEIISLMKRSNYNPLSRNKNERKIKTFIDFLNHEGIEARQGDVQTKQERGFFGTEYYLRIFNPHLTKDEDDFIYRDVLIFTL